MYPMDSYYFHVPSATGDNTPYPIVPSFAAWTMPDGFRLPRPVAQPSTIHESIRVWDQIMVRGTTEEGRSIATGLDFGCHACHLVPAAQHNWFEYHKMLKYAQSPTSTISDPTSHPENLVTLDANLHEHFDIAGFVLIPAPGPGDEWSIYSLMAKTDFTACFHGALVDFHAPPRATASAFLFARFAWAVLHLAKPHLSRPKLVKVRVSIQTMPSESSTSPPSSGDKRTRSSSATSTFTQAPSSSANPSMAAGTSLNNLNAFAPHRFAFPWSQTTVAGVPVITADEDNVSAPP
ncbi:hypothetical protein OC842_004392 [Tilletia horrida]|uniref:HNH nuclease domain-containing protein n=1 Tax=Tilletia horrida TaxID=155126 RepID=A0AAN6G9Q6_9BASI|nr:hypothetical protein OC842_004392 [Tilletia horrida]